MAGNIQVQEYALACEQPHFGGLALFAIKRQKPNAAITSLLDLGCGACVYHSELYGLYPNAKILGIDASSRMLDEAKKYSDPTKTSLALRNLSDTPQSTEKFELIFSSLVLHQLQDPSKMWERVKQYGGAGTRFVIFDLLRAANPDSAQHAVDTLTPYPLFGATFREDFRRSLLAAFTLQEIDRQLKDAGLLSSFHVTEATPGCGVVCVEGVLS